MNKCNKSVVKKVSNIKLIFYITQLFINCIIFIKMSDIKCEIETQGSCEIKRWFKDGQIHRDNDEPAVITSNGAQHWYQNGQLHRDDGPALICPYGSQHWYKNGLGHREDGPAVITSGYEEWKQNGKLHRIGGPAYKHYSSNYVHEFWYVDGKLHRDDGPAVIQQKYKAWYKYGELHRIDGPAMESTTIKYYYLFGDRYEECKFNRLINMLKKFNNNLKRKYRNKINLEIYNNTKICRDVCNLIAEFIM
jgi:hypothetical protein